MSPTRPTGISTLTSITSAGAAPIPVSGRRSMRPPPDRKPEEAAMGTMPMISRRQFVVSSAAFGGGMALGIVAAHSAEAAFLGSVPLGETDALPGAEFTPWISIGADDIVTVRVATPEIGNGAMTQTPMLVAEELACDWNKIRAELAPTSRDYREDSVYSKNDPITGYVSGRSTNSERTYATLWRHRREGRDDKAAGRAHAQATERVGVAGQSLAGQAQHPADRQWQRDLWHGCASARHGLRRAPPVAGPWRQGEELRRRKGQGDAGCAGGGCGRPGRATWSQDQERRAIRL